MNGTAGTASAIGTRVTPPTCPGEGGDGAPTSSSLLRPDVAPSASNGVPPGAANGRVELPPPGTSAAPPSPSGAVRRDSKRQRTAAEQACGPVMPLRLCIPMLVVAWASGGLASASAVGAGGTKVYRGGRRPVAGSRPPGAPDVDYGGVHPFDEYRHEYDPAYARRRRRAAEQAGGGGGLRSDGGVGRGLKKEDDKKDKDKDKDKWADMQILRTSEPTARPTDKPTGEPSGPPPAGRTQEAGTATGQTGQTFGISFESDPVGTDTSGLSQVSKVPASAGGLGSSGGGQSGSAPSAPGDGPSVTTLNPANDHLYKPMRILFDTRQIAESLDAALAGGDAVAATKLYLLMYEVLPMTARTWGDILRVVPVTGGIYPLAARGSAVDQLLPSGEGGSGGGRDAPGGSRGRGAGGDDPVRALYCPEDTTSGIEGGGDLLVYATVERQCGSAGHVHDRRGLQERLGTLASALPCQRDQYDRPITGSIDFCLDGMKDVSAMNVAKAIARKEARGIEFRDHMVGSAHATDKWDGWAISEGDGVGVEEVAKRRRRGQVVNMDGGEGQLESNRNTIQYTVGVAVHEIGHVIGVTSDSLAFFRHPLTGHPLTKRPFEVSTVTCINGVEQTLAGMPGPAVLGQGVHEASGGRYFEIVTPTVRRVVQNQFDCPEMTGARLENQPTSDDCFGSHFDEKLHYTEIMGAVFSQSVNILSPLTLALLEDSGWYRANYESEYVRISMFGHGAGCPFVDGNCLDGDGNLPPSSEGNFCNDPISISSSGLIEPEESGDQTCDPSHTHKTYCDYVNKYEVNAIGKTGTALEEPPEQFLYDRDSPNYRPYIFTQADYCPVPHLDPQSCLVPGEGRRTPHSQEAAAAGETRGPDSRCVTTDGSRPYSLCLRTTCDADAGKVRIDAGGQTRTCDRDGQVHTVLSDYGGSGPLRIKCPKAALVCPDLFCPLNCAGRGRCVYRREGEGDGAPLARCECDSGLDPSEACLGTEPAFPEVYGYRSVEEEGSADKTVFLLIVGGVVGGLATMYVVVRQWKARQNVFM